MIFMARSSLLTTLMRIASLSPAITEILFGLEQGKNIVCTDQQSDFPDAAKAIPHPSDHQSFDVEALRAYNPDVVFTSTLAQEKLAAELKEKGFAVVHLDPHSIVEIYDSIRQIGIILGCDARAEALIGMMQQGLNDTKRKAAMLARKPRVYVEQSHNPQTIAGNWVPELVKIAGGIPFQAVNADRGAGILPAVLEEVQAFDPDLIVLCSSGAGAQADKELFSSREGWGKLRAVTQNHLFVIENSLLSRGGPRLIEGARRFFGWCFQVIHS